MKVTASDADDPTYGSSARVVYSVLDGEKFFTVDRHTGKNDEKNPETIVSRSFFFLSSDDHDMFCGQSTFLAQDKRISKNNT